MIKNKLDQLMSKSTCLLSHLYFNNNENDLLQYNTILPIQNNHVIKLTFRKKYFQT